MKSNPSFKDLSEIICKAIEDEPFFSKEVLVPKIKAIMSAFKLNLATSTYESIESPSESAKRIRTIELKEVEMKFWKDKIRSLVSEEQMNAYFEELDVEREEKGFPVNKPDKKL